MSRQSSEQWPPGPSVLTNPGLPGTWEQDTGLTGWAEGVWGAGYMRDGRKQKTCAPSKGGLGVGSLPQPLHIWAPKKQTKNNTALETVLLGEGSLVPM